MVDVVQAPHHRDSDAPLFQVAFGIQNVDIQPVGLQDLTISMVDARHERARYDLTLWMAEDPDGLGGYWTYSVDLFDPSTIERMSLHFQNLLSSISQDPDASIDSFEYQSSDELEKLAFEQRSRKESRRQGLLGAKRKPVLIA